MRFGSLEGAVDGAGHFLHDVRTMPTRSIESSHTNLAEQLASVQLRLRNHSLYEAIRSAEALRIFAQHHVVCVLDFMSLLKSLQRDLTCVSVPWFPTADPASARLIHSIVVDEESDVRADGRVQSHFVWYLEAMEEIGADTLPARALSDSLARGTGLADALRESGIPMDAKRFGEVTAEFLERPVHVRAAVFLYGREEIIPEVFLPIVERLDGEGLSCPALREYLLRHIEIDQGDHGPLAAEMLEHLCRGESARRREAEEAALVSLQARARLWDAIVGTIERSVF